MKIDYSGYHPDNPMFEFQRYTFNVWDFEENTMIRQNSKYIIITLFYISFVIFMEGEEV